MGDNKKNWQRNFIIYAGVLLAVFLLFQLFMFQNRGGQTVQETTYSDFLAKVDAGQVSAVELDEQAGRINFVASGGAYYTGFVNDPGLLERLEAAKTADGKPIAFNQVVPEQQNIWLSLLINFLPMLVMIGLGVVLFRSMSKRMGGDAMSFGKSNAQVYVQAQTGITFQDVAGQDEAKEAVGEIVDFLHNPKNRTHFTPMKPGKL